MNYLLFGFPVQEHEGLFDKLDNMILADFNNDRVIEDFIYDHYYWTEGGSHIMGIKLAEWEDEQDFIDVKSDTLTYLHRTFIEEAKKILDEDFSLDQFRIIGVNIY